MSFFLVYSLIILTDQSTNRTPTVTFKVEPKTEYTVRRNRLLAFTPSSAVHITSFGKYHADIPSKLYVCNDNGVCGVSKRFRWPKI
jgi:hypothetical protein